MNTYIVRPYYGFDCDSHQGFNNGHYLDDIVVTAETEESAVDQAIRLFQQNNALHPNAVVDGDFGDATIYWALSYHNDDGDEISEDAWSDLNDDREVGCYMYQYIDFNTVEEVDNESIGYNQEPEINPDR